MHRFFFYMQGSWIVYAGIMCCLCAASPSTLKPPECVPLYLCVRVQDILTSAVYHNQTKQRNREQTCRSAVSTHLQYNSVSLSLSLRLRSVSVQWDWLKPATARLLSGWNTAESDQSDLCCFGLELREQAGGHTVWERVWCSTHCSHSRSLNTLGKQEKTAPWLLHTFKWVIFP